MNLTQIASNDVHTINNIPVKVRTLHGMCDVRCAMSDGRCVTTRRFSRFAGREPCLSPLIHVVVRAFLVPHTVNKAVVGTHRQVGDRLHVSRHRRAEQKGLPLLLLANRAHTPAAQHGV